MFRLFNTRNSLDEYIQSRNYFKQYCKIKHTDIQEKHSIELIESRKNANLFWKTVKKIQI